MRYVSVFITVLLLAAFLVYSSPYGGAATSTIVVPDDYSTIQAAVDAASAGDTVFVKAGTYHENVVVNESIFINGEDANTTIIDGSATGGTLVSITASNVTVSNFTIKSHSDLSDRGIVLSGSNFSNIKGNVITGLWYWDAVVLDLNSSNNILYGNYIAKAQGTGIFLNNTSRANRIINNTIYLCGIAIYSDGYSNESVILHNSFIRNIDQVYLSSSPNTLDDGYPSGGNLWAGYVGTDLYNGPNQDMPGSDGICDVPYAISGGVDRYPLFVSGQDATVRFYIEPSSITVRKGQTFNVTVKLDNMPEYPGFVAVQFAIAWNSSILNGIGISDILFHSVTPEEEQDNIWQIVSRVNSGDVEYACLWYDMRDAFLGGYAPVWGNHSVATITLTAVAEGTCVLNPVVVKVGSEFGSFDPEQRAFLIHVGGLPTGPSLLNHTITGCTVEVKNRNPGDCNGDDKVDIMDTILFSHSFGSDLGDLRYDEAADQNLDGVVDIYDVLIVAANFGKVYT